MERPPIRTTRERIIETAARLFTSKGFHQTSIDEIAQEASVAKGSVYYHFSGKDHLLVSVIQEGVKLIQETVEKRLDGSTDPMTRLLIALGASYDVMTEYHELARFALVGGCEGVSRNARKQIDAAREAFEADIEARVKEVVGETLDPVVTARVLIGALEGAVRAAGDGLKSRSGVARAARLAKAARASRAVVRPAPAWERLRDRAREMLLRMCEGALTASIQAREGERAGVGPQS